MPYDGSMTPTEAQGPEPMACDHCGTELRTGMPDGRAFDLVHANGARRCPDGSGRTALYQGRDSVPYVMG